MPFGVPPPVVLLLPPPQAACTPSEAKVIARSTRANIVGAPEPLRRQPMTIAPRTSGNQKANRIRDFQRFSPNAGGVVLTFKVAVPPLTTELGFTAHCGVPVGAACDVQVRVTGLLNPFTAEMLSVEVADCPALIAEGLRAVADSEKSGGLSEANPALIV